MTMDKLKQAATLVHEYVKSYPYAGWVVAAGIATVWWLV